MKRVVMLVWLVVVWVTLWEAVTWANVIGGVAVALAITGLLPQTPSVPGDSFRPIAAVKLLAVFAWELTKASAFMAWEVITPRNRIEAAVIAVPLTGGNAGVTTLVANMVSLTPGTLTLDVDEENRTLFIHVLHLQSDESTRESVLRLERLTLDAFPHDSTAGLRRERQA